MAGSSVDVDQNALLGILLDRPSAEEDALYYEKAGFMTWRICVMAWLSAL